MKFTPRTAGRATAATVLLAGLSVTGCSAINYQATTHVYSASDGTMADAAGVKLRHIMFIGAEEGAPARLVGLVSNNGLETADVELSAGADTFSMSLEPGESINLQHEEEFIMESLGAAPGSMQEVTVNVSAGADSEEQTFNATINDGVMAEYRDLLPEEYDESMSEHLIHGPDTWGSGAAHYDPDNAGH